MDWLKTITNNFVMARGDFDLVRSTKKHLEFKRTLGFPKSRTKTTRSQRKKSSLLRASRSESSTATRSSHGAISMP